MVWALLLVCFAAVPLLVLTQTSPTAPVVALSAWMGAPEGDGSCASPPLQIIIDTDLDYDDLLGLFYAVQDPCLELRLVTVANSGFVLPAVGAQLAQRALAAAGAAGVPVANGTRESLSPSGHFPEQWRQQAARHIGTVLPAISKGAGPVLSDATAALKESLRDATAPLVYVTLGPMTNLAVALKDTDIRRLMKRKVGRIVVSGGAFVAYGNVNEMSLPLLRRFHAAGGDRNDFAEVNIFLDATAADSVLQDAQDLGIEVGFMATGATDVVESGITPADLPSGAREGSPLALLLKVMQGFDETMPKRVPPKYWDAMAVVGATDWHNGVDGGNHMCSAMIAFKAVRVEQARTAGKHYGATVWQNGSPTTVAACERVNRAVFVRKFWGVFARDI